MQREHLLYALAADLVVTEATALRRPEAPACSAILDATPESREAIAALATKLGLQTI